MSTKSTKSTRPSAGGGTTWAFRLFIVVALTLAAAYYVPLHRTHQALLADYASLAEREGTVEKDLTRARADLNVATARSNELSARHHGEDVTKQGRAGRLHRAQTDLATALAPQIAKQEASIGLRGEHPVVTLPSAVTDSHGKVDVPPSVATTLCAVATTLSSGTFAVTVVSGVAGGHSAGARSAWDDAAARAAAVARTLDQKCHYPPSRIATRTEVAASGAGSDDASRIDVEIDSTDR